MVKRPFFIFISIISGLIFGLLWFTQSPQFAQVLKSFASKYVPKDLGISGDFSEISIKFFPPGFSLRNAKLQLGSRNLVQLPAGSKIEAKRIDFTFQPFQILSGDIRVHEVAIVDGEVSLVLDMSKLKNKATPQKVQREFHWDELFQVRAEGIAAQNVQFSLKLIDSSDSVSCKIDNLKFAQWSGKGGLGYSLDLNLGEIEGSYLKKLALPDSPTSIAKIEGKLFLNALGIQIESLAVASAGINASISGQVKGNILDPKTLLLDGKATVEGKLAQLVKWIPYSMPAGANVDGTASLSGTIQGNLLRPMETLKAYGSVKVNDLSFLDWRADLFQVEGAWEASRSGGQISIEKSSVSSRSLERKLGKQIVGNGGKVEIGPAKWVVGSNSPVSLPLKFENAHVHWLGAGSLEDVFPLDFRLNGTIGAVIVPGGKEQPWEVQAQLDTWVDKFQLSNQRLGLTRPLNVIFSVPRINLNGGLIVNSVGVHTNGLVLSLPRTKVKLAGKFAFKTGYDLRALGQVNFGDLGHIAQNEIRGQGALGLQIKGPAKHVLIDIDVDAKDAYYLGLDLGSLKGRLTWDDGPQYLIFKKPELTKATTHYTVDGYLDLGKNNNDAYLDVNVSQGNIHDFIQIFHGLVDDISWFPHLLNGPVSGTMKVSGGLALNQIHILAELKGTNWEQWGERFKSVYLLGGYDRGKYYIEQFRALKRSGHLAGNISYEANKKVTWKLETEDFSVNDLDYIAQLNVPIRGTLKLQTSGEGIGAAIKSHSNLELLDFKVRGVPMAPSSIVLRTRDGIINTQASVMGGQGVIDAVYDLNPKEWSYFRSELTFLDFSPVLMLFNAKAIQDQSLAGLLSGALNLRFHSGHIERANGNLAISEYVLGRSDAKFSLVHPVTSKVEEGSFNIENLAIQAKGGEASLDLRSRGGELTGTVSGELDMSVAEFFSSALVQANGPSNLDLKIGGSLKKPAITGQIALAGAAFRISSLDSQFENVTGNFFLKDSVLTFKGLQADLGDGKISAGGRIVLYSDRYPELDLEGSATGAKLRIYPFQYAKVNGNIQVHGQSPPYLVDGDVKVLSAVSKEKFLSTKQRGGGLKALQYTPPQSAQGEGGSLGFKLDIDVEAPKGIIIQNDLFRDVEVKGSLKLVNTLEAPGITGTAEVLQGKLLFKDHVFQIISAGAKFDNPNTFNPSFDLSANAEVSGIKIQMYATGKSDSIKIELTSTPTMPESEILSLLAVGITSNDAKKLSANDLSVLQQGEAASLVLHSLDFNRDLEDKTGFHVQLDQSVNPQQGVSAFRPQSQSDTAAAPQITIRRRLGDRLNLSAGSTVGLGTSKSNQVNLDFSVNKNLSISGVFNNYGAYSSADTQATQTQNSLGLDLKFQKRFK